MSRKVLSSLAAAVVSRPSFSRLQLPFDVRLPAAHRPLDDNEVLFDSRDDGRAIHIPSMHQGLFGCRAPDSAAAVADWCGRARIDLMKAFLLPVQRAHAHSRRRLEG